MMDDPLKLQYEAYPYPYRDPELETPGRTNTIANPLPLIGHYLFNGQAQQFQDFRALVAGGGTGNATVHLAEQLAAIKSRGQVIHLDISAPSIDIARRRIEKLGLSNVRFVEGSLLDVAELDLGSFDYVNCSGVLHHLEDPLAGARALRSVLKQTGGMSIMLYGALGRTGVYHFQRMMGLLRSEHDTLEQLIADARHLLTRLPASNWLPASKWMNVSPNLDDNEIVDLLLHFRDRAYRIPEIFDLLDAAGLRLVSFLPPMMHDPLLWIPADNKLHAAVRALGPREQAEFCELFLGGPHMHIFFAAPCERKATVISPTNIDEIIPVILDGSIKPKTLGQTAEVRIMGNAMKLNEIQAALLHHVDNSRTLGKIIQILQSDGRMRASANACRQAWEKMVPALNSANLIVFRAR